MGGSHDEEWHVAQAKKKPLVIIDGKEALEEDAISKQHLLPMLLYRQ